MTNTRKKQLLLILAGVLVGALIYFAPRQKSAQEASLSDGIDQQEVMGDGHEHEAGEEHNHEHEHESEAFNQLDSTEQDFLTATSNQANKVADIETKLSLYDSLIQFSIKKNIPPLVAKYTAEKAKAVPTENNWMMAGDNYFKAFRLSKNKSKSLIKGAVSSYQEVLELNSENLDAQTALGVAYVEGASQLGAMPMKGIGILKEVINKDPKNVNALTNLGYFAIQSGQYEKAIERFESILEIDPENAEAYLYLTDIYLSQDEKEKGIETLEKYKSLVSDPLVLQQVEDYIKEIENK